MRSGFGNSGLESDSEWEPLHKSTAVRMEKAGLDTDDDPLVELRSMLKEARSMTKTQKQANLPSALERLIVLGHRVMDEHESRKRRKS